MSLADTGAKPEKRGRLLWLGLILSLVVNVFFVGGLIWSRQHLPPPGGPVERFREIGRDLRLESGGHAAFEQFLQAMMQRTRQLRESNRPLLDRIWDELAKPQPDQALVASLVDQAAENRHGFQRDMMQSISQMLAKLTPEQRAQFTDLAKKYQDPRGNPLRRLVTP
jgi:uncharacterized membrane protein